MKTEEDHNGHRVCPRCQGEGLCRHDVAPMATPVAKLPEGWVLAEVTVACDLCGGCGLIHCGSELARS